MSVEILDGETIRSFVEDEEAFNVAIHLWFTNLDTNNDGHLSYIELNKELMSLRVFEKHFGVDDNALSHEELVQVYGGLFSSLDHDGDGVVDLEEFKAEMKKMMLAVAEGLGFLPVQMVVGEGSLLKRAVEREIAMKIAA
ncbi:Non-specific serine/threonine protein kinase protein [Dioscorea alata]|uniref:Non-specific serine/threonine protein kinase protein n=1 Tax=Dioscorea alata TaxID=55571 RepID=A0ACB7TST0_DIOAL|nr:Non-specific serine/threonine protein kinase protein [Dioscorea alata]